MAICAGEKSGTKTAFTFLRTLAGSREEKSTRSAGIRVYSIIEQQRGQCSLVQTIAPKSYIPISRYVLRASRNLWTER